VAKHIVGLVGSARRLGNTELLVKEALASAREAGADVSLVRLSDLEVRGCTGCMRCAFKGVPCPIDDDAGFVYDSVLSSDGFVVGAPTYVLGPPGPVKTLIDRSLEVWPRMVDRQRVPAATIAVAGLRGWAPFTSSMLGLLALCLGGAPVGSMIAYGPGPGQAALDPTVRERARELGRAVVTGEPLPVEEGTCPVCRGSLLTSGSADEAPEEGARCGRCPEADGAGGPRCPICDARVGAGASPASHRWTGDAMREHWREWILASKESFLNDLPRIKGIRPRYEAMDDLWESPPRGRNGGRRGDDG